MAKKTAARKKTTPRKKTAAPTRPASRTARAAKAPTSKKISFKSAKRSLDVLHGHLKKAGGHAPERALAEALGKVSEAVRLVREACAPETMARAFAVTPTRKR